MSPEWIGQFQDSDSQALLTRDQTGIACLIISGTRLSDGKLGDLLDDIDLASVDLGNDINVERGAYEAPFDMGSPKVEL